MNGNEGKRIKYLTSSKVPNKFDFVTSSMNSPNRTLNVFWNYMLNNHFTHENCNVSIDPRGSFNHALRLLSPLVIEERLRKHKNKQERENNLSPD